jgi:hypothetical protein
VRRSLSIPTTPRLFSFSLTSLSTTSLHNIICLFLLTRLRIPVSLLCPRRKLLLPPAPLSPKKRRPRKLNAPQSVQLKLLKVTWTSPARRRYRHPRGCAKPRNRDLIGMGILRPGTLLTALESQASQKKRGVSF